MPAGPSATSFSPGPKCKLGAMKKACGNYSSYALRYIVLDKENKILYYFKTPKDATPRRTLDLNKCTIAKSTPDEGKGSPGFKISVENSRDFVFVGTNVTVVDDWITAIIQAKQPQSTASATPTSSSAISPLASPRLDSAGPSSASSTARPPDVFVYNGPTLAVLPNRGSAPPDNARNGPPGPPGHPGARPPLQPKSFGGDGGGNGGNNTTLIAAGNAGASDTNSTLVAGGQNPSRNRPPVGQPVTVIVLTPDNKKFPPIEAPVTGILKIGRYVGNQPQSDDTVTFKSKVISRNHAEIWSVNGEIYIRDTRSQSGTFLNAMRLSEPSKESKPYRLKPGDVIQFGVDYKGATEDNARCISVRVDFLTKILDAAPMGVGGKRAEEGEGTLVGSDGTTLVGNGRNSTKTGGNDRTLVGAGGRPNDDTLYQQQQQQMQSMPGNYMAQGIVSDVIEYPNEIGNYAPMPGPNMMMMQPQMGMMGPPQPMMRSMGPQMGMPPPGMMSMGRPPMGMR